MQNEDQLLDSLIAKKTQRPATDVFGGVSSWFKSTFGSDIPVKNLGASDFERKAGWEHSRAFDVGIHPNSAQGQALLKYLDSQGIPYSAFAGAVSKGGRTVATGPHIHVGPPSHSIGSEAAHATSPDDVLLDDLLNSKSLSNTTIEKPTDKRGAYMARAQAARNYDPTAKLAHDIQWHFGYGVLASFDKLPQAKQQQIAQMATEFAQADEAKKKTGVSIPESPAWKLRNQKTVGVVEGRDIEARTTPEVDAQQRAQFAAGANPLLKLSKPVRVAVETLAMGGAGLLDLTAGIGQIAAKAGAPGAQQGVGAIARKAASVRSMSAEAEAARPLGTKTRIAQGVGSGLIEFAPLMLIPELGLESALAKIGAAAATGGAYTGVQAVGQGKDAAGVIKEAGAGAATFGLLGVPLPGKNILRKAISNLVITGGGATVINLATGQPLTEAATQGLMLSLMRAPELIGGIKIKDEKGVERPATPTDLNALSPERVRLEQREQAATPAKEFMQRGEVPTTPSTEDPLLDSLLEKKTVKSVASIPPKDLAVSPSVGEGETKLGEKHPVTGRKYSSTQVDLPPDAAALQKKAAAEIPTSELAEDGRESDAHITVKYGLHTEDAADVQKLLADEPPIKATIGKVSIFKAKEGADYDVVKMDVDSPDLHRLNAKIAAGTKVTDTHPEYKPHVTLAYVKPGEGAKYEGKSNALTGKEITLDNVMFSSRNGDEVKVPLTGQPSPKGEVVQGVKLPEPPKFKGQEGSATLEAISGGILGKINKVRQTIVTMARTRQPRDVMAYSRDAGDNAAMIYGERMKQDVEGPLRAALGGKLPKEAGDALSFVVESQGNPNALADMRNKIASSTEAAPGWKKRALVAIDYAQANYAQLQPIAQRYGEITSSQVDAENAAGIDTLRRDGYVMHAQDIDGPETGLLGGGGGTGEASGFKKVRVHETFADSIAAGINPKTLNALDLLSARVSRGTRLINKRAWVSDLKTTTDPKSGLPITADPVIVKRADGSSYPQPPQGYALEYNGFEPIAVQHGYEGIYSALTDPSWFSKNAATRGFMKVNAAGKSISLMLDTFHLGRLALWESLIKGLGVKTFEAPLPSYRKGLTLLDTTPAEITRRVNAGEIPESWGKDLLESKRRVDLLVKQGYNVGGISDALHQELVQAVPVVGQFNKWLFSQFQRGAMTEVGLLEYERLRSARPEMTDEAIARQVSKDLNTRFGNLGRQGIFKSRTWQDIARSIALAPQWNEGLIRSELGALTQGGKFIGDLAQGKRIYAGVLLRSVGGMFVAQFAANQLINMYTRGHPTWENPEEDWGAKMSAWIPDKLGGGPGFFLNPMGLAAETTHLLMKGYERTEDFSASLNDYLRSRASTVMRPALTFLTRRDYLGRVLKPGTVWGEVVNSAIPTPIPGRALYRAGKQAVTGKQSEQFPGQFQKQLMSSFGVRTESVPSGEQRIRKLAGKFNEAHGLEKQGEFYDSPYQALTQTLTKGGSVADLNALIEDRMKNDFVSLPEAKKKIREYYENRVDKPLTGNKERERAFLKTLNPEQRQQYNKSKQLRRDDLVAVRKLLQQVTLPTP